MSSILKVSEIQDPTNGNTALSIDSSGRLSSAANPAGWLRTYNKQHFFTLHYLFSRWSKTPRQFLPALTRRLYIQFNWQNTILSIYSLPTVGISTGAYFNSNNVERN